MKPRPWTCEWCDPREVKQPIEATPTTIRLSWGVIPAWEHKCYGCGAHRLVADDGGELEAEGLGDGGADAALHAIGRGAAVLLLFLASCSCASTSKAVLDKHEELAFSRESSHEARAEERTEAGPVVEVEEEFVWPAVFEALPDGGSVVTGQLSPRLSKRRTVTHLPVALGPATVATRTETARQATQEAGQATAAVHEDRAATSKPAWFLSVIPVAAACALLVALLVVWRRWV